MSRPRRSHHATRALTISTLLTAFACLATEIAPCQARLLRDIHPTRGSRPSEFCVAGPNLFFAATDAQGRHLYKVTRTRLDRVSTEAQSPADMVAVGASVIFVASTPRTGRELWISDGTARGTRLIRDILSGVQSSSPSSLRKVGSRVFFAADDGVHGRELWSTTGSFASTRMVEDIETGRRSSFPEEIVNLAGTAVFTATQTGFGRELFRSDGTASGTRRIRDLRTGPEGCEPQFLSPLGGHVYFRGRGNNGRTVMFRTDGTERQTLQWLLQKPTGTMLLTGGVGFMPMSDPRFDDQLFRHTGAFNGHTRLIPRGISREMRPRAFVTTRPGAIFYTARQTETGRELYFSDGTLANTRLVRDVRPGHRDGIPRQAGLSRMAAIDSRHVVFAGFDENDDAELWISDGTEAGTYRAQEINPRGSANPQEFIRFGRDVFFVADDGVHGFEPFVVTPGAIVGGSSTTYGSGCTGSGTFHTFCTSENVTATPAPTQRHTTIYAIEISPSSNFRNIVGYDIMTAKAAGATTGTMRGSLMLPRTRGDQPFAEFRVASVAMSEQRSFHRVLFDDPAPIPPGLKFFITVDATEAQVPIARTGRASRVFLQRKGTNTWTRGQSTPYIFRLICRGTGRAAPLHSASKARLGQSYDITLDQAARNAPALYYFGASDRSIGGVIPLPLDLAFFGAPGCAQLTSAEVILPIFTDGIGSARFAFSIPRDPSLPGTRFYTQFVVTDARANARGLTLSNGVRTVISN